mmetsp:Transcript_54062/g.60354  ORF Transcript_54062/g.60354 Transcript_54062/m.60354 type:complete len:465 (+) Transcript_54062:246-1640(+)
MSSKPENSNSNITNSNSNSNCNNTDRHLKVNNNTLTKEEQDGFLRLLLPACQPQEGSPANTFTKNELDTLQKAVGNIKIKNGPPPHSTSAASTSNKVDIRDVQQAFHPPGEPVLSITATTSTAAATTTTAVSSSSSSSSPQSGDNDYDDDGHGLQVMSPSFTDSLACTQDGADVYDNDNNNCNEHHAAIPKLDWHGAPRLHKESSLTNNMSRYFRETVRRGEFITPTNGVCPGYLQCNLVVLPQGQIAFDFLLFCQRNPKACPLIEVCDVGSPYPHIVAPGADLRTDVPKYAIYRDGKLDEEVTNVIDCWPEQSVAFLIGCSFSYDGELMDAGIPLKSASQGKNVPMYKTNLKCRPAGSLSGNMVVSMKPIPALQISKHVEITSKYTHAHGGPVAVGSASAIGITDINKPEWGEPIDIGNDEVPVFHACGVTPQSILLDSKVPFAITHSAGHMFVTDLPSTMGV